MKYQCPNCQRILYNRRLKNCGYCGAAIPEELCFTPAETAVIEQKMEELEASRKQRKLAEEATQGDTAGDYSVFIPPMIS